MNKFVSANSFNLTSTELLVALRI